MLDGFEDSMEVGASTANFTVYQGNTSLAVFPLDATPFEAATNDAIAAATAPIDSTGTEVAGKANRFVITNQNGDTALTGTISGIGGGGDLETSSLTVTAAATQAAQAAAAPKCPRRSTLRSRTAGRAAARGRSHGTRTASRRGVA